MDLDAKKLAEAKGELDKLVRLGPVLWLVARDKRLQFTFYADLDGRFMPPLVLDQLSVFHREGIPWGAVTWAFVSEEIDRRLRSEHAGIAPHEWRSGTIPWLIDVVAPFGDGEAIARSALKDVAASGSVWARIPDEAGRLSIRELRADA